MQELDETDKLHEPTFSFQDRVINSRESDGILRYASRQACNLCEPDTATHITTQQSIHVLTETTPRIAHTVLP